jgi:glycosyltransferase involved in cell wall biosynthesis
MDKRNYIDISVIVPAYNAEKYLRVCVDSLIHQGNLSLEIILVNDGSTDRTGTIADEYAKKDNRIKVIHQENGGASTARNAGLGAAIGEYIAFFDSDDWVKEGSLLALYNEAVRHHADVVMGNIWLCHQDGSMDRPFKHVSGELLNKTLSGKEGFIRLVKTRFYLPMPFMYIYHRKYLQKIQARFEEGIMHEDELWSPVVLSKAERMVISSIKFYYYRQSEESVMHTTSLFRRLDSLFRVTDRLFTFADQFDFSGDNGELKNWWYVNIFRLYSMAFTLLYKIKDSSYIVPKHHLDRFWRDCWQMIPDSQQRCRDYYRDAEKGLKKYIDWRISDWVASIGYQLKDGKKFMLIYNVIGGENLSLNGEVVPNDWLITTDRRYFQQVDVVVFYLPDLAKEIENDLEKQENQMWVAWYLVDTEKNYPWINDSEFKDIFDLQVYYPEDEIQKEHPLIQLCRAINNALSLVSTKKT